MSMNEEIKALKKQRAHELTEIARHKKRKAEVPGKHVRDEARRQRFVKRIDREIEAARKLLALAEGNLMGMGVDIGDGGKK